MKQLLGVALAAFFWMPSLAAQDDAVSGSLKVMTFNIRYGTAKDGDHAWPRRRAMVKEVILEEAPHILGVQEALAFQMKQLDADLAHWDPIGVGRNKDGGGEFSALFVDRRRLEVLEHGTFWLSKEPEEPGSTGWDAALPRICTWAVLRDRHGGRELRVFNTHFDHRGTEARLESARLVGKRAAAERERPVIVMGDLNADEGSPPLEALTQSGLQDTFRARHPDAEEVGTFTNFVEVRGQRKIDYVLARDWEIAAASIVRFKRDGRFPSDHLPVTATLRWR